MNSIPVSTQWTLDAVGEVGRNTIKSVFMMVCPKTSSKGTGFLLRNGYIVSNEHVIRGCQAGDVKAISFIGENLSFSHMIADPQRDLALLKPNDSLDGGLLLASDDNLEIGTAVSTWGYPLGYNGPAPLLSVGYLAGFMEHRIGSGAVKKHLVVNGAFNPGNSGGPLFSSNKDSVIGIVVSKHAPISQFHQTALEALAKNRFGLSFTARDEQGNTKKIFESQLVADLLYYFRNLTQVMIGEAVAVSELRNLLSENQLTMPEV